MNEQQYRTVIGWFNARPAAKKALRAVSTGAAVAVYLLYLGLLAWLACHVGAAGGYYRGACSGVCGGYGSACGH